MFRWLFGWLFLFGVGSVFSLQGMVGSMLFAGSPSLMVADSSRDHLVHLQDLDSDGRYDGPGEASIFYDDSSAGPQLSVPTALIATSHELLLLDGGTLDALIALQDLDGDGTANSAGEVRILYDDDSAGPDLVVPISMTLEREGRIFIADRSTTRRHVLLLVDQDGDGDMDSPGESSIWLQRDGNPQLSDLFLPTAVLHIGDGQVLVADASNSWIYRCQDLDGDGIVEGDDEVVPWFTAGTENSILTVDAMERRSDGSIFICDEDLGTVLHLHDLDANGTISDLEVTHFIDGQSPYSSVQAPRRLFSLPGGALLIGEPDQDGIFTAEDLDGDGNANAIDEQQPVYIDGGELLPSVAGISLVPGPLSIHIDQITPQLVDRDGGNLLLIEGGGWAPGSDVQLRIAGLQFPANAPINTLITATLPELPTGSHDLTVIINGQDHFVPSALQAVPYFLRGDVDASGTLSITDAIVLLEWLYLPGSEPISCLDAADLDDSGSVQLTDAIVLLSWLFASGPPPALPHPLPGADPAQNGPGCTDP